LARTKLPGCQKRKGSSNPYMVLWRGRGHISSHHRPWDLHLGKGNLDLGVRKKAD